jgi:hypothetical protein
MPNGHGVSYGSWLCKNATTLRWRRISIPPSVISRRRNFVGLFCAIDFGKLFSPSLDFSSFHTARVIRVGLTLCRPSPVRRRLPTCRRTAGVVSRIKCTGTVTLPVKPGAGGETEDSAHCDCASRRPKFISENPKFGFPSDPNQFYIPCRPRPHKGRFAIVTNVGLGMRWTRVARLTSALSCGRRSRVVLTPRRWRQVGGGNSTRDGGNKARSPGRARNKL